MNRDSLEAHLDANIARYVGDWQKLLRFASISSDPAREQDCRSCAEWLAGHLSRTGMRAELVETGSKPMVMGERGGPAGAPTVLFYGHYDVQPVDPIDKWHSPPFEPEERDGRIYARGAVDNKGQLMFALAAMDALIGAEALRYTVKVLLEGEEESGSAGISRVAPGMRDRLAADILMVCDTGKASEDRDALTMGLRGMVHISIAIKGAKRDLHSGGHGGIAPNPAEGIAALVATLHNADGSCAVEGFYDNVAPPENDARAYAEEYPFDANSYEKSIGVPPVAGEKGFAAWERMGFRPTIDVNGIQSGYGGPGVKTIIPSEATAKISSRLVPEQDPKRCLDLIVSHLETNAPEGLGFSVTDKGIAGGAVSLSPGSAVARKARDILREMSGKEPALKWEGASIPAVSLLSEVSGGEPLLVGFGCENDNAHAPNESFAISRYKEGFLFAATFLGR